MTLSDTQYTMYIYKTDRRCKSGERLVSTSVWIRDEAGIKREVTELAGMYPSAQFRIEVQPTMVA